MEANTNQFKVVLVTHSQTWKGGNKLKLTVKGRFSTKEEADTRVKGLLARSFGGAPDYRVVDAEGYGKLLKTLSKDKVRRLEEGKKKAQATRERNAAAGKKRRPSTKVACPQCGSKSRILFSEMGGLQTRRCASGHEFTFDKWIADRAFWNPAAAINNMYGKPR